MSEPLISDKPLPDHHDWIRCGRMLSSSQAQRIRGITLLILAVALHSSISAQQIRLDDTAVLAFADRLSEEQLRDFEARALAGDPTAQVVVAVALHHYANALSELSFRDGAAQSADEKMLELRQQTREWLRKAAQQGNAFARVYSVLDIAGQGADCENLLRVLTETAESGSTVAMSELGHLYSDPRCGIAKDYDSARMWLGKAFETGAADAAARIADLYRNGKGVEQDDVTAFKWMLKAAEKGYAPAQNEVGIMLSEGIGVPASDQGAAVGWFRAAAEQGNIFAAANLGLHYARGQGVKQDYPKALEWIFASNIRNHRNYYVDELMPLLSPGAVSAAFRAASARVKDLERRSLGYRMAAAWLASQKKAQPTR